MKKILGIVLTSIMLFSLAACGGSNNVTQQTSAALQVTEDKQETTTQQEQTTIREETTEETTTEEETTADLKLNFSATIEETVLVDDMGVKITATDLTYNSYQAMLAVTIENNTDKDLTFLSGTAGYPLTFVNGYMVTGGYMNVDVAAGMKTNETINFSLDELALFGMKDIAEIGIAFEIEEGFDDYLKTGPAVVKTSADPGYDYGADTFAEAMRDGTLMALYGAGIDYTSEEEIFNNGGVSIGSQYIATNKDGECLMFMEVKNDSASDVHVEIGDVKVNGIIAYSGTWSSDYIIAGKRAVASVNINDVFGPEYMAALGFDKYSDIEFAFRVVDKEYYSELGSADISIDLGGGENHEFSGEVLYSNNDISIMSGGVIEDPYSYSNDVHALFIVKNGAGFEISIDDKDGAYVDKTKLDYYCYSQDIRPGDMALLDVEIDGDDFEDNGFKIEDISEISMTFEIKDDNYKTFDEPAVTMNVAK